MGRAAVKMLVLGVAISLPVSLIGVGLVWLLHPSHVLSAGIGAIGGLAAMASAQAILAAAARLSPQTTLVVALGAFSLAIIAVIALLSWIKTNSSFDPTWVAGGIIVAASFYLLGAGLAHARLRIPLYSSLQEHSHENSHNVDD